MYSGLIAIALPFISLVTSVSGQASSTVEQSMPPSATEAFDIAPISQEQRSNWCLAQNKNCPLICDDRGPMSNKCEPSDLSFECICSNGTVPDVSAYKETIPFYLCDATFIQCIAANPNDSEGQTTCKDNRQCGELDPTSTEESSSESSSSSSSSSSESSSSDSSSDSDSDTAESTPSLTPNSASLVSQHIASGAFGTTLLGAFLLFI